MCQSDITSGGGKGSEWKYVVNGNDIWTQTTFHKMSCKGLNMHLLTKHSPVSLLLYGFYAAICYKNTNQIVYLVLKNMIKEIRTFRNSLMVCASLNETSVAAAMANKFLKPLITLCGAEAKVG
jgi:hypothetical protein